MVAAFLRLPVRLLPFRREASRSLNSASHLDARRVSTLRSNDTETDSLEPIEVQIPMYRKGNDGYAVEKAIVSRTIHAEKQANSKLKKTLVPSRSPRGPASSQDGNIKHAFQRGFSAKVSSHTSLGTQKHTGGLGAHASGKPLAPASGNEQANPGPRFRSICADADPFKDEVHGKAWNGENFASLDQDLAWLEQSLETDDLDFDDITTAPAPVLPTAYKSTTPATPAAPVDKRIALASSQGTEIPWSSSPPHHMRPPPISRAGSGASDTSSQSLKRKSLDSDTPKVAPKRRNLPFDSRAHGLGPEGYMPAKPESETPKATPAVQPRRYDPSEATASAIKEQRKSHKLQRTQSTGLEQDSVLPKPNTSASSKTEDFSTGEIRKVLNSSQTKKIEPVFLSTEQRHVMDIVTSKGQSVFFTGPAGTGKSVLMRAIIAELKRKWAKHPERLAVTASTGLAACNIGGITLHSFSGIGLGKEDVTTLVRKIRRNPKARNRWLKTKCLVIDEISMVDGELFDKLNQIGRTIRNNGRPWGGIQLVITGDFFQLPPVPDNETRTSRFSFEASTWNTSITHTIGLNQVFRQRDPEFAQMLNEMRLGKVSDESVRAFREMARPLQFDDGVEATELFPTRAEVERSNSRRLAALPGKSYRFEASDTGDPKIRDRLLQNMMATKVMDLKVGAQVMLIKNIDEQLCNGTIGKVKMFATEGEWLASGDGNGTTEDEPIDLARAAKKLKKFAHAPESAPSGVPFPVVEFLCQDGSHRTLQCIPDEWKVELPNGEVQAKRQQVPLILAWALSIHKAQGQTLERVKVDLTRTFENGQAYVALSRATTQQGLQVIRFEKSKVMAHPRVVDFYSKLYSAEQAVRRGGAVPDEPAPKPTYGMFGKGSSAKPKEAKPSEVKPKEVKPREQSPDEFEDEMEYMEEYHGDFY